MGLSMRGGLAVRGGERAENDPRVFQTNEVARSGMCSVDLLSGDEWRRVGCVIESELEFRQ